MNQETRQSNEEYADTDRTAVTDAVWNNQTECLALLLQAGGKPNNDSVIASSTYGLP